jgi:nucleoside-diphosphate-sugar epimerase
MSKVLIIGGNGYIGTKLYQYLISYQGGTGYLVDVIDTCWFGQSIEETIVKDYKTMSKEFYSEYETIILLAGHSSVKMSEASSNSCFNNNVKNFIRLLEKLTDRQQFIYASSSSVYGSVGGRTVNEKYYGFEPYNQYDISKHTSDLYAVKSELQYYGLRFGTVNGYSPVLRTDVMINAMVNSALKDREIKLFIKDTMRPILGIDDLCRGVETIIDNESDQRGLYNLASFNKTAEQIAYEVGNTMNVPVIEYESDPTNITNVKNQTKTYNFSISTLKFRKTFKFSFKETVESITESLVSNWDTMKKTDRSEAFDYE